MHLQINNLQPRRSNVYRKNTTIYLRRSETLTTPNIYNTHIPNNYYNPISFSGISKTSSLAQKIQKEKDEIYMLLNYALVHKNWQAFGDKEFRGFNIGAILVNSKGDVVDFGLNSVYKDIDRTRHAETNLIQNYLNIHPEQKGLLENFSIYTSLEPCAMCSGAMMHIKIGKIIYGINDPGYGGTIPRLLSNKSKKYIPYPIRIERLIYQESSDPLSQEMRKLYRTNSNQPPRIIDWLNFEPAKELFSRAQKKLNEFKPEFSDNQNILKQARIILEETPTFNMKNKVAKAQE